MLKYAFLICLSFSFAYSFAIENIKITKKIEKDFINVNNTEDCGGASTFLALRVPGCTSSPCQLLINVIHQLETDFRLAAPTQSITFTNNILIGGVPVPIFVETIQGPFNADTYTLEYTFTQATAVTLDIRYTLESASGALQICRELTLQMIDESCLPTTSNGISHRNKTISIDQFLTPTLLKKSQTFNVEGVRNCGSNGDFNALFVPGCSTQPCRLRSSQFHTLSFLFNPSRTSTCVEFEQFVFIFGQWISLYKETSQENLVPGGLTLLAYELFSADILEFIMPLRSVLKTEDGATELCLEFDVVFFA